MKELLSIINESRMGKVIFQITLGASIFWIVARLVPIYENKIIGAVFEMLWLPAVLILFVLPIFSFLLWAGEKFRIKSAHLLAIILAALAILSGFFLGR